MTPDLWTPVRAALANLHPAFLQSLVSSDDELAPCAGTLNYVKLTGLKPDTAYYYIYGDVVSSNYPPSLTCQSSFCDRIKGQIRMIAWLGVQHEVVSILQLACRTHLASWQEKHVM